MPFFLIFGAVSVGLFNIFYMIAIDLTTVTTAVMLLYTAPAFSMLMARVFLKETLTVKKNLAVFLTFAGIILLVEAAYATWKRVKPHWWLQSSRWWRSYWP